MNFTMRNIPPRWKMEAEKIMRGEKTLAALDPGIRKTYEDIISVLKADKEEVKNENKD